MFENRPVPRVPLQKVHLFINPKINFLDQSLHAMVCREKQSSFTICATIGKTPYLRNFTHIFFYFWYYCYCNTINVMLEVRMYEKYKNE